MITSTTKLQRHPNLVSADMDGDTVMMSIERGEYFGVSGVGPRIWTLLAQPLTPEELATSICAEYDVDHATCLQDVLTFVQELAANGLIDIHKSQ